MSDADAYRTQYFYNAAHGTSFTPEIRNAYVVRAITVYHLERAAIAQDCKLSEASISRILEGKQGMAREDVSVSRQAGARKRRKGKKAKRKAKAKANGYQVTTFYAMLKVVRDEIRESKKEILDALAKSESGWEKHVEP